MTGLRDSLGPRDPLGQTWDRSIVPPLFGLALPMAVLGIAQGPALWLRFAAMALLALGLQVLFARVRARPLDLSGLVTAAILAIAVPPGVPLYQLVLGVVFGVVVGEQVFGGRGRSFLHPAVVALAFLTFSFAGEDFRTGPEIPSWTLLPALALLLWSGQASWRILVGAAGMVVLSLLLRGDPDWWQPLLQGSIILVLLYLAADPVAAAATDPGRWIHGALVGALAALLATVGPGFGAAVFAVLLGAIFAPLVDRIVIAIHAAWRERRHG